MFAPRCLRSSLLALLALGASTASAGAQANQPAATVAPTPAPPARASDVETIDAIIAALYDVISGDAGVKRDWDRFRSLFIADARLIPTGRAQDGSRRHRVLTPEDYVRTGAALERDGFHEREIGRRLDRYGHIAHVMSAYDSRRSRSDAEPFARGINSIQLWNDGKRWWVVTIYWEGETPENPIPAGYLSAPGRR